MTVEAPLAWLIRTVEALLAWLWLTRYELLSPVVSVGAVVITIALYRKTKRRGVQPVLVFARHDDKLWRLQNVGNGPVLNLVVCENDHQGKWRSPATDCDALAKDGTKILNWLTSADKLGAEYTDVDDQPYHTICERNRNKVCRGKLPDRPQDLQSEWQARAEARKHGQTAAGRKEIAVLVVGPDAEVQKVTLEPT